MLPGASSDARTCAWHEELVAALEEYGQKATMLEDANVIIPSLDVLVPHYPSFLWECRRWPGGHDSFAKERLRRTRDLWLHTVPEMCARLSRKQQLLLFDVSS